jgi:bis(5'-nucleosyl)-tetraphosphatase (symmetrical)
MAIYAIGDIQGCYYSFLDLLKKIKFKRGRDQLWLVGDLVNRGNGSLEILRWCYKNKSSVTAVLGNHDLHALAIKYKVIEPDDEDTLSRLLKAKDSDLLFKWLRSLPLVHYEKKHLMVHAGVMPQWTIKDALKFSKEVSTQLRSKKYIEFLSSIYGNKPEKWSSTLNKNDKARIVINATTRLRALSSDGAIDFTYKGELKNMPKKLKAWFDFPKRKTKDNVIVFGHWSALGLVTRGDIFSIDTGCVWGRALTAIRLDDKSVFSVKANSKDI